MMTRTTMAAPPIPSTKGGIVIPSGFSVSDPGGEVTHNIRNEPLCKKVYEPNSF
jgi:hypothetical protein